MQPLVPSSSPSCTTPAPASTTRFCRLLFVFLVVGSSSRRPQGLLSLVVLAAVDRCPPNGDCGPFGICITDSTTCDPDTEECDRRCSCQPGYFGDDCSFEADLCPEVPGPDSERECFNGGLCYEVQELSGDAWRTMYRCDCRTAVGQAAVYAGPRCEFPGEVSCEKGKTMSSYAFCVNGGKCKEVVESGELFDGCNCVGLYEGRHCQYDLGTAPQEELIYMPPTPPHTMSALALTSVIVVALGFLGGMFYFMYRRIKTAPTVDRAVSMPPAPELDENGDLVLQEVGLDEGEQGGKDVPVVAENKVIV